MEIYEQGLHINDATFASMREGADLVIQRLVKSMVEKESTSGSVTIKIDLTLVPDIVDNMDPDIDGDTRKILKPKITHRINSVMQIKDEEKGGVNYDGMELVYDKQFGEYVMRPIANTYQRSIFDADFTEDEETSREEHQALEGRRVMALPGEIDDDEDETDEDAMPFEDDYGYDSGEEF